MKINTNEFGAFIRVKDGADFVILRGAPSEWAKEQGATHSLLSEIGGVRPAILGASRIKVAVDEDAGSAVWETWNLKSSEDMDRSWSQNALYYIRRTWKEKGVDRRYSVEGWNPLS